VLEGLKKLFARKPRGVEVEYERQSGDAPAVLPSNPPTSGLPPAVPVDRPAADSEQN